LTEHQSLNNYYTKSEVDALESEQNTAIAAKAPQATTYTKTEVDNLVSPKANSSDLATVATSGSYNDLSDKPTIPSLSGYATESYVDSKFEDVLGVNAEGISALKALTEDDDATTGILREIGKKANLLDLSTVAFTGDYDDLSNKPTIPSLTNYYTKTEVDNKIDSANVFDPTQYYNKTATDNLITDTKQWVTDKNYLTTH